MKYRNDLKKRILAGLLAGAALCLAAPAAQAATVVPNDQFPQGGNFVAGNGNIGNPVNGQMDIQQNTQNAVIKWDGFNIGANAIVNFKGPENFNTLNYDISGSMSQIYGTINAKEGNIYIVNPNGVEIGNSAQINTGSLYVSNKNLDKALENITDKANPNIANIMAQGTTTDAALMSLGNINASKVTFEGNRVVIDTERIKDENGDNKLGAENIIVHTNDASNVVIGYDAYNEENKTYAGANNNTDTIATVNGTQITKADGYMWVEDVEQLQAINTNLSGNYALRNSIDATATKDWNDGAGFASLGTTEAFNGKFDGLDYNIFNLNINRGTEDNVGLFGVVGDNAVINNVTLVGGSVTGGTNVGALAGSVQGGAHISNITNSASVTGTSNVGGLVGESKGTAENRTVYDGLVNTGTVISTGAADGNGGTVSNAGGLIGYLEKGKLGGASYNLGAVKGQTDENGNMTVGYNVGGLVGHAVDSVIGNQGEDAVTVYNRLNVTGAYNVGGIVGNMEGTQVYNAENSGDVSSTGSMSETYVYHTADKLYGTMNDKKDYLAQVDVLVSNVGGIAGTSSASADGKKSEIKNATNLGNVNTSYTQKSDQTVDHYDAGNVGGIVGRAEDTDISNATNRENEIRGAHNVGGIAGYFGGSGTVSNGINDGGDIMATGARAAAGGTHNNAATTPANDSVFYGYNVSDTGYALEHVRNGNTGRETVVVGNMGGIVGYMDGDGVYVTSSANRGTVHSQEFTGTVPDSSKAANAGGIVGKIDRNSTTQDIKNDYSNAAVSNSYNTGDVRGYTGVGGIAGMMYNGEIAGSYNLGKVNTTRQPVSSSASAYENVNMGGIVGDTTEGTGASALLYDVYNKGQIGDETFQYYARHVGGIVGRLSGTVEKAYNTGAIYNGYNVVGGIAGWMAEGSIKNAFNTGNITVVDFENSTATSQVGGIVGGAWAPKHLEIANVYNLGTLRAFKPENGGRISLGGIVGAIRGTGTISIKNVYTTGNLYAAKQDADSKQYELAVSSVSDPVYVGSIWGQNENSATIDAENTYYIKPAQTEDGGFKVWAGESYLFPVLGSVIDVDGNPKKIGEDNSNKAIDFDKKDDIAEYQYGEGENHHQLFQTNTKQNEVNESDAWRIYDGSTPILNAFLPNAKEYFDKEDTDKTGIGSIQYGTAYDPLLTIINANKDLSFNWQDLGINNDAGLAVYGAGLTLNDFMSTGGSGYFGGLIYSDGALNINAHTSGETHDAANTNVTGNVALGSASQLYGSSVAIDADGQVTIYGSVTATGNVQDGTSWDKDKKQYTATLKNTDGSDFESNGSISITGGSVDIYGQLTSADGQPVKVPGINGMAVGWSPETDGTSVSDPKDAMSDIGDRFGYTTQPSDTLAQTPGNISITANDAEDGHVNVYYGNKGEGIVTTGGDLTVTASGDVYMDSDLSIGGNLTLNAGYKEGEDKPAADSEAVLDISNIGKVQAANDAPDSEKTSVDYLHEFMHHFENNPQGGGTISFTGGESKIAVDMWDEEINEGKGGFNLKKYDSDTNPADTFVDDLNHLNFTVTGDDKASAQKYTYIWVSTGEQLAGIQDYKDKHQDSNILSYNFALKNDIDASNVTDYKAIGSGEGNEYTGTFDGRDNRIIGLDTTKKSDGTTQTLTNAGIFGTIGTREDGEGKIHTGTVEDLRVYSGTFTGTDNAGAVAGVNKGNISNVTAFGNVVTAQGSTASTELGNLTEEGSVHVGAAGGIAGVNYGTIDNASAVGTATAADAEDGNDALSTAGGIAGINMYDENINKDGGIISNSTSNSAVNASAESTYALGGVAGVNAGKLDNVDSLGVTTGLYKLEGHNSTKENQYSDNVGGIAGMNSGMVTNVYNESIVSGRDNVGGIFGENSGKDVSNVANAADVTGEAGDNDTSKYVGGLAGSNSGSITGGRNNGEITGNNYVGGLVGSNGKDSTLTNLVNDSAAAITGDNYVGGIAGSNAGTISADEDNDNLINRGTITGQMYVGGVAGENTGTIANTHNDVELHVRYDVTETTPAKYFGGVAGINGHRNEDGTIIDPGTITSATNTNDIIAPEADYVGGIVGWNPEGATLNGMGNSNEGRVEGASHVGGVAGLNEADIKGTVDAMIGIENSGVVIAHNGGAGGIFGENKGAIEYVEMTNNGIVSGSAVKDGEGTDGTGGIFGVNSGDVTYSSLKNEIGGQVMGTQNVGGLIGVNTGNITGGRTEADNTDVGYYKYQIYNNGTITVEGDGSNIGGLIGNNAQENGKTGSLTAGYNTGAIVAKNGTNVGGIAGTNAGTLDQVFNTVITGVNEDGSTAYGSITGSTNVGGIAGTNTGSITNAYNTTAVTGNTNTGSIVGNSTGTVENVYATVSGSLIGNNGAIKDGTGYVVTDDAKWNQSSSYNGFDFTGSDDKSAVWKIYEGSTNPLLKVFLTQLTVNETAVIDGKEVSLNEYLNLVYNGKEQDINIQDLIDKGFITGPDGMKDPDGNSFVFDAYNNTKLDGENPLGNSALLQNTTGQKYADEYDNWLTSAQISAGNGTVNNLGYDIDLGTRKVNKAQISISLDEIHRTYGNEAITNITQNTTDYGFTISNVDAEAGLTEEMESDLAGLTFTQGSIFDDAVDNLTGEQKTDNAGNYNWKASFDLGEDTSEDSLAHNFEFVVNGQGATEIIVENGVSKVNQANLTIDLNDVNMTYGQKEDDIRGQYGYSASTEAGKTLVNGDTLADVIAGMQYTNTAYNEDGTTKDVLADGTYALEKDTVTEGDAYKNYNVTYTNGDVTMEKASVVISADDKEMHVGDTIPAFTGTDISSKLVNGDTLSGWSYGPEGTVDSSVGGSHIIGVHFGNGKYAGSDSFDWTTAWDGFKNYNVTFTPGTLTVRDFPEGMPDIPEIPGIENHWNGLLGDNPWDRNRDFRERKAEIHYIAGGMTL